MHNRPFAIGVLPSLGSPKTPQEQGENGSAPSSAGEHTDGSWPSTMVLLGRVGGIGWFVSLTIAVGAYAGYWIDRQLDTAPILTILGLTLGVLTAFVGMFRFLKMRYVRDVSSRRKRRRNR
jgi:hypothetical protein